MDANNVRQRLEQVVVQCGFNLVTEKSDKLSHYYEFRHKGALTMTVIRISNHCTDISTWRERYGSINPTIQLSNKEKRRYRGNYAGLNDKYFQKYFFSIVVFDPTTDGVQNCGDVNDGSFFVKQIVYDATKMTNENLVDCENFVKKIASGNITENINYNRIMKKNRIRLTESQLHRVIKESVKRALNEENGFSYLGHMRDAIEDAIYSTINDLAAKKAIEEGQLNMMKQSLSRFVCGTFEGACRQLLQRPYSSFYNSLHDGEFLPPSAY